MKQAVSLLIILIIAVVIMKLLNIGIPISVTTTTRSSELSVIGEGKVEVVPDVAYADVGITVNRAATQEAAQSTIDKTNQAILDAMQQLGIDKKNIKTSNYSIFPSYNYDSGKETLDGYNGNVTITIKTSKVEQISQVIEAATKAGANQIQGTRFEVENPAKYREDARAKAIANAKEQAQKLAGDLDIKLGKVVNVVEYSPSIVQPVFGFDKVAMSERPGGGGGGPAVEPGSQTITSVVTLYYEKR